MDFDPVHTQSPQLLQWGVVLGASLAAAAWDLRSRRIPNILTIPLFFSGLAWAVGVGGLLGLLESLGAVALLSSPFVLLFVFGMGGAGDAKIMGAIGAWLGIYHGLVVLLAVLVAGVVCGVVYALATGTLLGVLGRTWRIAQGLLLLLTPMRVGAKPLLLSALDKGVKMPYGIAIFAGVCVAALAGVHW